MIDVANRIICLDDFDHFTREVEQHERQG